MKGEIGSIERKAAMVAFMYWGPDEDFETFICNNTLYESIEELKHDIKLHKDTAIYNEDDPGFWDTMKVYKITVEKCPL